MPNWTESQKYAIETPEKTLLVSAGAGSGKTTVLTQRLLERILKGDSISDFLVVTFTKASASDLRDKLYRNLGELASAYPQNAHIRRQLYLLPEAHIGTIHSFCGAMIRSHFQLLGRSPKIRFADEQEARLLKVQAVSDAVDAGYDSGTKDFLQMAECFTDVKNDRQLEETMLALYDRLRAFDNASEWLADSAQRLLTDADKVDNGLFQTSTGKSMQDFLIRRLEELEAEWRALATRTEAESVEQSVLDYLNKWTEGFRTLSEQARVSQEAFLSAAEAFDHGRLPGSCKYPPFLRFERDEIKKKKDSLVSFFRLTDRAVLSEQFRTTGKILNTIRDFLNDLDALYDAAKREKGVLDFDDAEHLFLSLLKRDGRETEVCKTLRGRFKEIYIDEYQDVSPLQDRIFTLLSNGHNRFMVGDVKQSIYRFRNAYPDIFLSYKDRFPEVGPANDGAEGKIFLRENFRSASPILDFTNLLFHELTCGTSYEREYKGEELVFARGSAAEERPEPVTVVCVPYEPRRTAGSVDAPTSRDAVATEAAYIADEIAKRTRMAEQDKGNGLEPKNKYSDFALLFLVLKDKTAPYEEALRARGIPYRVSRERLFFEQPEIQLALDLLRAVDDPTDDISLFGCMRSPLFGFTAGDLYRMRSANPGGPLIRSVRSFAESGGPAQDELEKKASSFLSKLDNFRIHAEEQPCHAFLWELFAQTGLLYLCGNEGRSHLLMLYENARSFEQTGYKGLSGFLSYLRIAEEKRIQLPAGADAAEDDCVTLTTIHKSKGLEYPVVFLCGSGQALRKTTRHAKFEILRDEGLFFPVRDAEKRIQTNTMTYLYSLEREKESEYGETLRKLYVGCTRAKEKLYITGAVSRKDLNEENWSRLNPGTILEMVCYAIKRRPAERYFKRVTIEPGTAFGRLPTVEDPVLRDRNPAEPNRTGCPKDIQSVLGFKYSFQSGYAASLTASELKMSGRKLVSEYKMSQLVRDPAFLSDPGQGPAVTAASIGTANHAFLQYCDYERVLKNGMDAETEQLIREKRLSPAQAKMLDYDGLDAFFQSELFSRIRVSRCVEREKMFTVCIGADFIGASKTETVILKGLMDLVFEENDGGITIVDYKTDRVRSPRMLAQKYRLQMICYRKAIEEITGKRVKEAVLWSFEMGREIPVDIRMPGEGCR